MTARENHTTSAADKVPLHCGISYGAGKLGFALILQTYLILYNPIFNDTLGLNPIAIGWIIAAIRIIEAFADLVMGRVSDRTTSRWGRRRPWIAIGGVLCAICFVLIWWFPRGQSESFYFWWMLVFTLLLFLSFTVFSVPYIAMGMELSPDYHERTRVMTIRTVIEQFGFFIVSSLFYFTSLDVFSDRAEGMRYNSLWVGALILIVIMSSVLFAREHPSFLSVKRRTSHPAPAGRAVSLFASFKEVIQCWPLLSLGLITVVSYFGVISLTALNYYVTTYYLFNGSKGLDSGKLLSVTGYCIPVATMVALPLMNRLSRRIGKRNALAVAFSLTSLGAALRWPLYTPDVPYLSIIPNVIFAIGAAGAYLFINAMIPEAVDADELKTGERREGMFSGVYSWTYKLGASLAILLSGYVLVGTGFEADLLGRQSPNTIFWLRFVFSWVTAGAMLFTAAVVFTYPITEEKAYEMRSILAKRRATQG